MHWSGKRVLVTGGASFIGSHLVDSLVGRGAQVRVADDLSSGRLENLQDHLETRAIELMELDLREPHHASRAVADTAATMSIRRRALASRRVPPPS